jgi:hypothetical protein
MRLTRLSLYSSDLSEAISFSLRYADPEAQYIVRSIVGLDAEEIISKFYGFGLKTKPRFYDLSLKPRDIVMRISLNPNFRIDESYSDVRDQLYRAISATRSGLVTIHLLSGATTVAKIQGYISKFESSYFVETPEVQLTIRCDDPMFRAINPVSLDGDDISSVSPMVIGDSLSTAPHGFTMKTTLQFSGTVFNIQDDPTNPEWKFTVTPLAPGFQNGDELYLSSEYSDKALYMVRAGVTTYLADKIAPSSVWPLLFPGANEFYFVVQQPGYVVVDEVEFYPAYWGV